MEETIETKEAVAQACVEVSNTLDSKEGVEETDQSYGTAQECACDVDTHADYDPPNRESCQKLLSDHIELGKRGERAARAFLERHGFDILDTNWECPAGEADIIVWDGYALRFVEVKTRRGTGKGFPEEAVTAEKRARYERIAEFYLRNFDKVDIPIFFDIIGIVDTGEGRAFLRYHRDAFGRDYER